MPISIFSHQAPGLILKIKFPKKFDGVALCFGTLIPDFNFLIDFFFPVYFYRFTHSLVGQIFWTVPLASIISYFFSLYFGPFIAKIASRNSNFYKPLRYFGIDQWKYLKNKKYKRNLWLITTYSALIGGITHLLLDWPSHANVYLFYPWIEGANFSFLFYSLVNYGLVYLGPFTFELNITIYTLLWFGESIILLVFSFWCLRYIKKNDLMKAWFELSI